MERGRALLLQLEVASDTMEAAGFPDAADPPSSSYTFPVDMSYLTFCLASLSSVNVLLFSLGLLEFAGAAPNVLVGFKGVQFVKLGWFKLVGAARKLDVKRSM